MGKRFVVDFPSTQTDEAIQYIVTDFLTREGFVYTNYKGELVWKKGSGWMAAPQFVKVLFQNGQVHLEAWLKQAILPGVYCGEMGLTGAYGFAIKKVLKERVDLLIGYLQGPPAQVPPPQPPVQG